MPPSRRRPSRPRSLGRAADRRLARRLSQLFVGLALYGVSLALVLRAGLGLAPWDVLHQGLARLTGHSIGTVLIAVSFLVLLAWVPLRQRPGFGTLANAVLVGVVVDLTLQALGPGGSWSARILLLVAGILLNGLATALYIGASLGPGPRDGLMTGLVRRTGRSVRRIRTLLEVGVLVLGFALGGTVGVGTVLYAVAIGPIAHALLPLLTVSPRPAAGTAVPPRAQPDVA